MFQPEGFSLDIFKSRYAFTEEETWDEFARRVARQMAKAELPEKQKEYEQAFYEIIVNNEFVPGGRICYNSGRVNAQLLNCFVLGDQLDSKEGWGNLAREMIITSMTGGGCGTDFSDVRPRGAPINGQKGTAPGPVELMKLINGCAAPIRAGGQRRVALMFSLDLHHPDIMEFLDAKLTKGELTYANVSVRCHNSSEFKKLVEEDGELELHWKGLYKRKVKARELWDKVVQNAWKSAEPGFLNWELAESESNIYYIERLSTTNPCITGDTLIAVADGRNAVSIKQLTEEGKDVPVYSTNLKTGKVEIKYGRNPRITKKKAEVWKLTLDDGSVLRATPNHKILTKDLTYVELKDLKPGQSIFPFNSFNSNKYRQVAGTGEAMSGGHRRNRRQYRLIAEFNGLNVDPKKYAIHHRNFNSLDDSFDNLQVMTHDEHRELHATKMKGSSNPYHKMSNEWKHNFASKPEKSNGKWIDVSNDDLIIAGKELVSLGKDLNPYTWQKFAKERGLPQTLANNARFGNFKAFKDQVIGNHKVASVEFDCHEDVYNITVDDNHNYHVITSYADKDYVTSSGICVKNCGEICMSPYDSCDLGHLVLPRFVHNSKIDKARLAESIRKAVRFLDNVLTVNTYPLPEMQSKSHKLRRIGLGTTGLADALAMVGIKYGSPEGNEFVDDLFRFISKVAYEASIMLAIEKGPFPACDRKKHIESGFIKRMPKKIRSLILEHGIRNCAILTQAPTGTVSIVSGNCSSGVEPMFAPAYERRFFVGNERKVETVFHPLFAEFMQTGKSVEHFVGAMDLTVQQHLEVQRIVQKHIDNAVSKTINMPEHYPVEDMSKVWLEYLPELKGTTFYRDNSRKYIDEHGVEHEPPLKAISLEEAKVRFTSDALQKAGEVVDCAKGVCEI